LPEIARRHRSTEIVVAVFRTVFLLIVLFSPQFLHAHGMRGATLIIAVVAAACYNLALIVLHVRGLPFPRQVIVAGDVGLVSLWIYLAGPEAQPFFVIYYAVVIVAGLWFRVAGALGTAVFASALYAYVVLVVPLPEELSRTPPGTVALQITLLMVTSGVVSIAAEIQGREQEELAASRAVLRQHWQRIRIAQHVDEMVRPSKLPEAPGLDIAALFRPAAQAVSGDYYDVVSLGSGRWGIYIADVCAKQELALRYLPVFKSALRMVARRESSPAAVLREVNRDLTSELDPDAFIAMSYTILDLQQSHLVQANAGLEPGVVIATSGGQPTDLQRTGIVLGVEPDAIYEEQTLPLHTGDAVVVFTDGMTDASDRQGRFLGREGLLEQIRAHANAPTARAMADRIFDHVTRFSEGGRRRDDMTLLVVRVTAAGLSASEKTDGG
jgi:sigma-B regulation protein RsbU (phosphoserine phosphatase)